MNNRAFILIALACASTGAQRALAQHVPPRINHENLAVATGSFDGDAGDSRDRIAFVHVFAQRGAPWMRLGIADANLGHNSFIILRSMSDNGEQRLNARSLDQWQNATAIFNGDRVMLELHVAPGDTGVFINFDQVISGDPLPPDEGGIASLCGSDDRVASTDNRVGRLGFGACTAWRTSAGVYLTAGHCVDYDLDQGGPGLPDGILDLSGVVEFNVPASNSNGSTVAADPDDQYPILTNNVAWQHPGANASFDSVGRDWGIFTVGPNSNTGLTPEQAYGMPFRLSRETPAVNTTMRITGFGADTGATNSTNQTSTGPFVSETITNANEITLRYQVDTEGGNSGSPVIWESNQLAIGIHTNAGCGGSSGSNAGTSLEHDALESWIGTVAAARYGVSGLNIRFVDLNHPLRVVNSGTPYRPYDNFITGVNNVPNNGMVSVVAGNYTAALGNTGTFGTGNRAMIIVAPAGTVTIGN